MLLAPCGAYGLLVILASLGLQSQKMGKRNRWEGRGGRDAHNKCIMTGRKVTIFINS